MIVVHAASKLVSTPSGVALAILLIAIGIGIGERSLGQNAVPTEKLIGRYALSVSTLPGYRIEVTESANGGISIRPSEGQAVALIPLSPTTFQLADDRSVELAFSVDGDNRAEGFQLTNLFGTRHYQRLESLEPALDTLYSPTSSARGERIYAPPKDLADGLSVVPLAEIHAKPQYIYRLLTNLDRGFFGNVNSFLIVKNGALVVEAYFNGWSIDQPHPMRSVSKSVTSLLVGSAIRQGHIDSVHDPIAKYLPDHALDHEKSEITIRHLLTMSAGLRWDQLSVGYADPRNINQQVEQSDDSVAFVLERELLRPPGHAFTYSDGYAYVLGEVLRNATRSLSVQSYIQRSTLAALQFRETSWSRLADGRQATAFGLSLTPRDLVKIGQLLLNDGQWNGPQLLTPSWIAESTANQIETPSAPWDEYGYYWWGTSIEVDGRAYEVDLAEGFGGQFLVLIKELDLAIVSTAENYNFPYAKVMSEIVRNLVIPAFE